MACAQQPEPASNSNPTRKPSSPGEMTVDHDNCCAPTMDGVHHEVLNPQINLSSQDLFPLIVASHCPIAPGYNFQNQQDDFR